MVIIDQMIQNAKTAGYDETTAEAKVCQDIILFLISQSTLNRNITIKGGVVMRGISNNARRATLDVDLDFIRYPLQDESILYFIETLNALGIVKIEVIGSIEELKQQDYHGKRIHVKITDSKHRILQSKIDLGVHKHFDLAQEEYCFDIGLNDDGATLLINTKEQMLTEKLRSILKFGPLSTRYKDIFDIYYLSSLIDKSNLLQCFDLLIYSDAGMKENSLQDILKRVTNTFKNKSYRRYLATSQKNWLNVDIDIALQAIIDFLISLA